MIRDPAQPSLRRQAGGEEIKVRPPLDQIFKTTLVISF